MGILVGQPGGIRLLIAEVTERGKKGTSNKVRQKAARFADPLSTTDGSLQGSVRCLAGPRHQSLTPAQTGSGAMRGLRVPRLAEVCNMLGG